MAKKEGKSGVRTDRCAGAHNFALEITKSLAARTVGAAKILSYTRRPKPLGAQSARLPFGLHRGWLVAIGVFEIAAALALIAPFSLLPHVTLAQMAAAGLALLTGTAAIYHVRRHETPVPNLTLFILVLLVALGRWA